MKIRKDGIEVEVVTLDEARQVFQMLGAMNGSGVVDVTPPKPTAAERIAAAVKVRNGSAADKPNFLPTIPQAATRYARGFILLDMLKRAPKNRLRSGAKAMMRVGITDSLTGARAVTRELRKLCRQEGVDPNAAFMLRKVNGGAGVGSVSDYFLLQDGADLFDILTSAKQ